MADASASASPCPSHSVTPAALQHCFRVEAQKIETWRSTSASLHQAMLDAAAACQAAGTAEQRQRLKQAFLTAMDSGDELAALQLGLESLSDHTVDGEDADATAAAPSPSSRGAPPLQAILQQRMSELGQAAGRRPQRPSAPLRRAYEEATSRGCAGQDPAGSAQQPKEEVVDEDLAIVGGTGGGAPNDKCPLTLLPLAELQEAVRDSHGVVYEAAAIREFLRRKGGAAPCPLAGTRHGVTLQSLEPAMAVGPSVRSLS